MSHPPINESPQDEARRDFLDSLDDATHIDLTDWETQFLADHIDHPRPFTDNQRACIDSLRKTYRSRL